MERMFMKFFGVLKRFWKVTLVSVLLIGGFLFYELRSGGKSDVTYQTGTVTKGTLTVSVTGTGNVIVEKRASVNPGISGEVQNLSVKVGDTVEAGQVLFNLENNDLDIAVDKAYVTYLQAQQSLENAKSQLIEAQNARSALDEDDPDDNIAPASDSAKRAADQKVVAAELSVTSAEVNIDSAYASYNLQKENAAKRTVTAPIDGTVTTLGVTNGDQYGSSSSSGSSASSSGEASASTNSGSSGSSSSAAMVIDDLSSLQVSIDINEVNASLVKADQKVSMTFDAIDGLTLTGKVSQISTVGENSSGVVTYPATISFDTLDERVKQEMSVTATITTEVKQDVLMVANAAVKTQSSDDSKYVLLMKDNVPTQQAVKVGSSNDTYTEVTEGLSEGDTIVTQTISANSTTTATTKNNSMSGLGGLTGGAGGMTGGGVPPSR
jgi:multidrug efflux pump subunit AcrA (membrane-fusion protein)